MRRIHFLNVKNGDCSIIERDNRITVIDICCGNIEVESESTEIAKSAEDRSKYLNLSVKGNFKMKECPTNPIEYLKNHGIKSIHRFILTHPDMDHMDGISQLFENFNVINFWDNGLRRTKPNFCKGPYLEHDWTFYTKLIDKKITGVTVISPMAGSVNKFFNQGDGDKDDGDFIYIVSPNKDLVNLANSSNEINDGSYVVVYNSSAGKIIFPGDSEDLAWDYIINNNKNLVKDAAVLIAPHHGRDSDRNWEFLDVVNPRLTLIGNARSQHLNYTKYSDKGYTISNNQAGNIRLEINADKIYIDVENETFAKATGLDGMTFHDGMWRLGHL